MTADNTISTIKDIIILGVVPVMLGWFKWQQSKSAKTIQSIHILVNQRLGEALLAAYTSKQDKADASGAQQDIIGAAVAKKQYDDHQVQQAILDNSAKTAQTPPT